MQRPVRLLHADEGFTLVELIVVVVIAGILIGFSYSGFSGMLARYRCHGAINRISQEFKLAQMKAIEQNSRYYVTLGAGNDTLTIFRTSGCSNATVLDPPFEKLSLKKEYPGIDVVSSSCSGIYFNCRGIPKTALGGSGACTVKLNPANKPAEQGNVTISWMGRIQVATPDSWKY
jgi:prepilin-type N-terminal cleavage/methylation domain-containing protein